MKLQRTREIPQNFFVLKFPPPLCFMFFCRLFQHRNYEQRGKTLNCYKPIVIHFQGEIAEKGGEGKTFVLL